MKRRALLLLVVLAASGCESTLETGYEPRKLNMSLTREQTLYADPYSQQAMQARYVRMIPHPESRASISRAHRKSIIH